MHHEGQSWEYHTWHFNHIQWLSQSLILCVIIPALGFYITPWHGYVLLCLLSAPWLQRRSLCDSSVPRCRRRHLKSHLNLHERRFCHVTNIKVASANVFVNCGSNECVCVKDSRIITQLRSTCAVESHRSQRLNLLVLGKQSLIWWSCTLWFTPCQYKK